MPKQPSFVDSEIVQSILTAVHAKNPIVLQENERSCAMKVERYGKTRFLKVVTEKVNEDNVRQDILLHNFLSRIQRQKPGVIFRVPDILASEANWFLSEFFEVSHLLPRPRDTDLDVAFHARDFEKNLTEIVQLFIDTDITFGWHGGNNPLFLGFDGKPNHLWRAKKKEIDEWAAKAIKYKMLTKKEFEGIYEHIIGNLPYVTMAWEHGELWPSNMYRLPDGKIGMIDFDKGKMFGCRFFDVIRMYLVLRTKMFEPELAKKFIKAYVLRQNIGMDHFLKAALPLLALKLLGGAHDMTGFLDTSPGKKWLKEFENIKTELLSDEPEKVFI